MKVIKLLILLIATSPLYSQSQFSGWLASFNTFKTGKKTSIHFDAQLRSSDEFKQVQTILFRPGVNYHLNKNIVLSAGYAFITNKRNVQGAVDFVPEHRIWEQLIVNHKIKTLAVTHRFRIEQRLIANASPSTPTEIEIDGYETSHRFRYFIRNLLPLKKQTVFAKGVFVALQNEVFVNFANKSVVNNEFFDQNRLYLAAGYRLNPKADLELGYMNQYINGSSGAFTNNHIVQLAAYLRL